MNFIADLHIHSHYSLSTSRDLSLQHLRYWAQLKGITLIGAGDFTHPAWRSSLERDLTQTDTGLYRLMAPPILEVPDSCRRDVYFLPTSEVSCIFRRDGRTRKVHLLMIAPSLEAAASVSACLAPYGALSSDGRPILSLDARDLLEMTLEADPDTLVIPAHIWTPHFSVLGAASAFTSIEECFGDLTPHIHAIETGLSADPGMIRRVSALDGLTLISGSDAHSPSKIAREATIFSTELSLRHVFAALRTGAGIAGTLEFFPEEGKYFLDGHRPCGVRLTPAETAGHGGRCPACGKKVTVGVLNRVEELADRMPEEISPDPYESLVALPEIIAAIYGCGTGTKKVMATYLRMIEALGPELDILRTTTDETIEKAGWPEVADAIGALRQGQVTIEPGYDGVYGNISLRRKG